MGISHRNPTNTLQIIKVCWFHTIGKFYDAALRCFGEMVEDRQNCVHQSGRFAFSKIQNSTFSKLCPPSKRKLLMGNFSERLTQNEIYFLNFHQYSLRNGNYNASLNHRHDTSSDKWPWSAVILYPYWDQFIRAMVRHRLEDYCVFF